MSALTGAGNNFIPRGQPASTESAGLATSGADELTAGALGTDAGLDAAVTAAAAQAVIDAPAALQPTREIVEQLPPDETDSDGGSRRPWPLRIVLSPLLWLGLFIFLGHLLYALRYYDPNPVLLHSNLATVVRNLHVLPGTNTLDPNDGFTSQALAHRAMLDWVNGQVPWWNQFEGIGTALAGEMQSAAFFPVALFTLMPNGQVWMYLVLSLIAGYSTYFLVRRLGVSPWVAFAAGVCFGLNGTFAWFRFAPANPIAFLPLMLLGVELVRERVQQQRRSHWWIIAVGLSLSLVAGFPETAYLDGLLVLVWTLVRCIGLPRPDLKRYLKAAGAGALSGLLLAGPFLAGVIGFLPYASLGPNTRIGGHSTPLHDIVPQFFPYGYGSLWTHNTGRHGHVLSHMWGIAGGYTTVALVMLAVLGLLGPRLRSLRIALGVWCVALLAASYAAAPLKPLLHLVPGMSHVMVARYLNPSFAMALVVLAALALTDLMQAVLKRRVIVLAGLAVLAVAVWVAVTDYDLYRKVAHPGEGLELALGWGFLSILLILAAALLLRVRYVRVAAAVILILLLPVEAVGMFVIAELSAPKSGEIDKPLISYMQDHTGHYRFATLGPFLPDYGSYYGVASINANDLPLPARFQRLVKHQLDPNANPVTFTGTTERRANGPTPAEALRRYFHNYERLGVKYLLVSSQYRPHGPIPRPPSAKHWVEPVLAKTWQRKPPPPLRGLGLRRVYVDNLVTVYELPHARALFHANHHACTLRTTGWNQVSADCTRPAKLIHNELYMPGWSATVNGRPVDVNATKLSQQKIRLPAGKSTVKFSYAPKYAALGWLAAIIGTVACLFSMGLFSRRLAALRRWRRPADDHAAEAQT